MAPPGVLEEMVAGRAPEVLPLTTEQYHRMLSAGILREGEPVELIEGVLVRKNRANTGGALSTHGPGHATALSRLERVLRKVEAHGHHLRAQLPVALSPTSEPEPDGAVVAGSPEDFASRHPLSSEVRLVIEVADSSLEYDRTTKQRLYASAGIPEYWIVNLRQWSLEVHRDPSSNEGRYRSTSTFSPGDRVELRMGDGGLELPVADLLPPRS